MKAKEKKTQYTLWQNNMNIVQTCSGSFSTASFSFTILVWRLESSKSWLTFRPPSLEEDSIYLTTYLLPQG